VGGVAGTSLLAAPVLPRLGALTVTVYACGLAGILLLAAAVVLTGTGAITPLRFLAALAVLAVVILGLGRAPHAPAGTVNQAGQRARLSAETTPAPAR
jgi:hypothetical protein